jgi:V8-like Glu-specific endopeptidase
VKGLVTVLLVFGVVGLAVGAGKAGGQDGDGGASGAVVPSAVMSSGVVGGPEVASTYWTPERLRRARPALARRGPQSTSSPAETPGQPRTQDPTGPLGSPLASEVAVPEASAVPKPYTDLPDRTVGKVFFTQGGVDYACSGSALNSTNASVVWTAGHCVEGGYYGGWSTNVVYIPGYGSCANAPTCAPYGVWPAKKLFSHRRWAVEGQLSHDHGAAVVRPLGGVRLVEATGGNGMKVNVSATQTFSAFGYPAEWPFNGRLLWRCTSATTGRDAYFSPKPVRISCDMTGGSSGGPWLVAIQPSGLGYLNGATSYRLAGSRTSFYSPYFGDAAWQVFKTARAADPR